MRATSVLTVLIGLLVLGLLLCARLRGAKASVGRTGAPQVTAETQSDAQRLEREELMPEINKGLQTPKRPSPRAGLLLATAALLTLLPCLGLMSSGAYLWARQNGTFSRWRSLGAPPGGGAEIVAGDTDVVYVLTPGGAIYRCEHGGKRAADDCWVPAQEPLSVDPKATSDHRLFNKEVRPPPGTVMDTLDVTVWYAEDAFEARHVLLQDGTVWKWQYDVGGYLSLFVLILGPATGLGLGILAAVVLWLRAALR